jgi:hypothetical protein
MPREYYDDQEFIDATQGNPYGDDDYASNEDLAGIPAELWPEVDKKGKDRKMNHAGNVSDDKSGTKKTESLWPNIWDKKPYVYTSYSTPECHKGNILVFTHGNISVYGGGNSREMKIWEDAFMLDMGDVIDEDYVQFAGCSYPELYTIKLIKVACKDFGVPNVGNTFWSRLVDILKRESADKPIKVVCCCMGGHGRTGLALSILAGLFDVVPPEDCPVEWVREHYCKYAVESKKQLSYIEEVTGREVKAKEPESKWPAVTTPLKGGETTKEKEETTYPYNYGY